MADATIVAPEVLPDGAAPEAASWKDKKVFGIPLPAALLIAGGLIALIWLLRKQGGGSSGDGTIPTVVNSYDGSGSGTVGGGGISTPNPTETGTLPPPAPSSPYNLGLYVQGVSGQDFVDSLKGFNISGRVVQDYTGWESFNYTKASDGTVVKGPKSAYVELEVPTGAGQWWYSTLAKDWRTLAITPGTGYTSGDILRTAEGVWNGIKLHTGIG